MENEKFKKKIRRVAGISAVILSLYVLLPIYVCGRNFLAGFADGYNAAGTGGSDSLLELIFLLAAVIAGICAMINSLRLLLKIRREETPFTAMNARRIRRIGIMLMLLEPLMLSAKLVSEGELSEIYGITFCAGLILFNVSLLFGYGAHLQQESDETL